MTDLISRGVPLDDMTVKGRTVTAYAAVFDSPTEILDGQGHYTEILDRAAFNKTIREAGARAGYFYNHGMTIHGTPSDMASIPLGVSRSIKADSRGLLTTAEISRGPMGDAVLEAIENGAITGYSFTGKIIRSDPARVRRSASSELPRVRRMELGLKEYGPTPFPAYQDAAIVSVRSGLPFGEHGEILSETDRAALLFDLLMRATGLPPVSQYSTLIPSAGTEAPVNDHAVQVRESIRKKMDASGVRSWNEEAERNPQGSP